jgi:transcriptional regulator with XRE-family HTH domain
MIDGKPLSKGDLWEEYSTNLHGAYNAMWQAFKTRNISQDEIAARLDVDKALISKRLKGKENLTFKTLSFMASAMECRLSLAFVPYEAIEASHKAIDAPRVEIETTDRAIDAPRPSPLPKAA